MTLWEQDRDTAASSTTAELLGALTVPFWVWWPSTWATGSHSAQMGCFPAVWSWEPALGRSGFTSPLPYLARLRWLNHTRSSRREQKCVQKRGESSADSSAAAGPPAHIVPGGSARQVRQEGLCLSMHTIFSLTAQPFSPALSPLDKYPGAGTGNEISFPPGYC